MQPVILIPRSATRFLRDWQRPIKAGWDSRQQRNSALNHGLYTGLLLAH